MREPEFEWDEGKNLVNQRKHGIAFELAIEVFDDPLQIVERDADVSGELRWRITGRAVSQLPLFVVYTYRSPLNGDEITRIISARPASRAEKRRYERNRRTHR